MCKEADNRYQPPSIGGKPQTPLFTRVTPPQHVCVCVVPLKPVSDTSSVPPHWGLSVLHVSGCSQRTSIATHQQACHTASVLAPTSQRVASQRLQHPDWQQIPHCLRPRRHSLPSCLTSTHAKTKQELQLNDLQLIDP